MSQTVPEPPDVLEPPSSLEACSLEERILRALRRIFRAVELHSRQLLRRYHLTTPQALCLRHLRADGRMSAGELARRVSLSRATLTGILDRLEGRGLVTRRRSTVDRRSVLIELTQQGQKLAVTVPIPLHERFLERLRGLPEKRREEILRALEDLGQMMEAEDLEAAPVLTAAASLSTQTGEPPPGHRREGTSQPLSFPAAAPPAGEKGG